MSATAGKVGSGSPIAIAKRMGLSAMGDQIMTWDILLDRAVAKYWNRRLDQAAARADTTIPGTVVDVAGAYPGQRQRAEVVRNDGQRVLVRYTTTGVEREVGVTRIRAVTA